jgi:hypothetical protein
MKLSSESFLASWHHALAHAWSCSTVPVSIMWLASSVWWRLYKWKHSACSGWLNWSLLFLCEGRFDEHTTEICLQTEPSGSAIRSFKILIVFCQHNTLVDQELLKKVLNAHDVSFHAAQRSLWDNATGDGTYWWQLCTTFCVNGYVCTLKTAVPPAN